MLGRLGDGAHHPLEAGERLGVARAGGRGHAAEQRRGGDGGDEQRAPRVLAVLEQEVGEQRADLVAVQAAPAGGSRDGDGEPVGVGVVGEHHVGVVRRRRGQREVERPLLLGVGPRDGREVGIGPGLLRDDVRRREAGAVERVQAQPRADPVQRRVGDPHVARVRGGERRQDRRPGRPRRRRPARRRRRAAARRAARRARSRPRSARRRAERSGRRRRGRPCSRCPAAGCGWR